MTFVKEPICEWSDLISCLSSSTQTHIIFRNSMMEDQVIIFQGSSFTDGITRALLHPHWEQRIRTRTPFIIES